MLNQKKGQGLSVNAIILIILGVAVLVMLILGFTIGWDKIVPLISTNNVDTLVTACTLACSQNSFYDYCISPRDLKADETKMNDVTCNYLAKNTQLGFESCAQQACTDVFIVAKNDVNSKCAEIKEEGLEDGEFKTIQYLEDDTLKVYTCDEITPVLS